MPLFRVSLVPSDTVVFCKREEDVAEELSQLFLRDQDFRKEIMVDMQINTAKISGKVQLPKGWTDFATPWGAENGRTVEEILADDETDKLKSRVAFLEGELARLLEERDAKG